MRFLGVLVAALVLQSTASLAFEPQAPLRLKQSGQWIVEFGDQGCRMFREFGTGDDKTMIMISRYAPSESFRLTIGGKLFKRQANRDVTLQFGPNEAEQKISFMAGNLSPEMPAMILAGSIRMAPVPEAELAAFAKSDYQDENAITPMGAERVKAVTYLKVGKPLKQPIILELGRMDRPMAVMDQCIDHLMTTWGIDVQKHKNLKRQVRPTVSPGRWITTDDYPTKMLGQGQAAIVDVRLDVDGEGNAVGCHIQATTRPKEFDDAVCKSLMRRAKFTPALDADSKPIQSYWKSTVTFLIPQ
jgi:hypothetical protein